MNVAIRTTFIVLALVSCTVMAQSFENSSNTTDPAVNRSSKAGSKRRAPQKSRSTVRPTRKISQPTLGISLNVGWEAMYGHGLTFHYFPFRFFEINLGAGYNYSGPKIGAGVRVFLYHGRMFGLGVSGAFVQSMGRSGEIVLDASFKPEGSAEAEPLQATKDFEVIPAQIVNISGGGYFRINDMLRVVADAGYGLVVGGNDVTFADEIRYNKSVDISNHDEFDVRFREEATKLVSAGSLSASIGLQIVF